jgi:hypothetical protein
MAGRLTDVLMALAMGLENSMFHICSYYVKRVNRSLMEEKDGKAGPLSFFATSQVNTALAATLALLRTSKELSG